MSEFLQPDNTIDIISDETSGDYVSFFQPSADAKPFVINTATKISDILVALNLVQSKTWCRKNNWDYPLEPGYNEIKFGMKKVKLCIYVKLVAESETKT